MARLSGIEVARLAYHDGRGFPVGGDALVTAVAIAGWKGSPVAGESGGDPNAVGDTTLVTSKWGPSIGLWQVRSLRNPGGYGHPDNLRDASKLRDPQYNAEVAHAIWESRGKSFRDWTVYTAQIYRANMGEAREIVQQMLRGSKSDPDLTTIQKLATSGAGDAIAGPAEAIGSALSPVTNVARWIGSPDNWSRIGLGAAGVALLLGGAILLAREAGAAGGGQLGQLLSAVPHPAAQAGAAVASAAGGS